MNIRYNLMEKSSRTHMINADQMKQRLLSRLFSVCPCVSLYVVHNHSTALEGYALSKRVH